MVTTTMRNGDEQRHLTFLVETCRQQWRSFKTISVEASFAVRALGLYADRMRRQHASGEFRNAIYEAGHCLDQVERALSWVLDVLGGTHTAADQAVGRDLSVAADQLRTGEPYVRDLPATAIHIGDDLRATVTALRSVEREGPDLRDCANSLHSTQLQIDRSIETLHMLGESVTILVNEAESRDITEAGNKIAALEAWDDVPRPEAPTLDDLSRGAGDLNRLARYMTQPAVTVHAILARQHARKQRVGLTKAADDLGDAVKHLKPLASTFEEAHGLTKKIYDAALAAKRSADHRYVIARLRAVRPDTDSLAEKIGALDRPIAQARQSVEQAQGERNMLGELSTALGAIHERLSTLVDLATWARTAVDHLIDKAEEVVMSNPPR